MHPPIFTYLAGVELVVLGLFLLSDSALCRGWGVYKQCADFGGFSIPFSLVLIVLGRLLIWTEARKTRGD